MSLPVPLDQQIVTRVVQQLREITIENGYRTDAGAHVLDDESRQDIPDDAIVLEVLDDDEETEFTRSHRRKGFLQLVIAVTFPVGEHDASVRIQARKILADIRHAAAQIRGFQFPGFLGLEIGGRSMFVREAGSQFFRPQQRLRAEFNETHLTHQE